MTERLLQFIWQFQYYNKGDLKTTSGEILQIISPGNYNSNQGPDFSDGRIRIDSTTLAGSVELHILSTDWKRHGHAEDRNYDNVILHVVWEDDEPSSHIPVLELKTRVPGSLLDRYGELMIAKGFIPCEKNIVSVEPVIWKSWIARLMAERLEKKARLIENILAQNKYDWEDACWRLIARNFGVKINADAFEAVAQSIPMGILAKHKQQVIQLEALMLGQAGLLAGELNDAYAIMLQKEYRFLAGKYSLKPVKFPVHFLRMRPAGFPTIRLAQLAMLIRDTERLFSKILDTTSTEELKQLFNVQANDYWHYHYRFGELASFKEKKLGESMTENIIINTVAPLLFSYGLYHGEQKFKDRALRWIEHVPAEKNSITRNFELLGIRNNSAFDSQALIELKNEFCSKKRCLECAVGNALLKLS
jgi:hypothetical protein